MLIENNNPEQTVDNTDPAQVGDDVIDSGANDSPNVLDELGLGDNNGSGESDPGAVDPAAFKELTDSVSRLTAEIETERQARRTAEGRLRAERERSVSSDPYDDPGFDDNNLSDEARLVLRRQLDRERREDLRWRKFEEVNALQNSGVPKDTAERIWDLENSNDPQDYMAGLQLRQQATDMRRQEERDNIRKQQLQDRAGTPEGTGSTSQTRPTGHSAATIAKATLDKKISIMKVIQDVGAQYGAATAESVMNEYEKLKEAGYTPAS